MTNLGSTLNVLKVGGAGLFRGEVVVVVPSLLLLFSEFFKIVVALLAETGLPAEAEFIARFLIAFEVVGGLAVNEEEGPE